MLRWMQNENSFTQVMGAIAHLSRQFQDGLAKVDARAGGLVQQLDTTNEKLDVMGHRLDTVDCRLDGMDQRMGAIDDTLDDMGHRVDTVDRRLDAMDQRLDVMDQRLDATNQRMDALDKRLDAGIAALNQRIDASIETWSSLMWEGFEAIGKRFDRLEETVRALTERVDRMEYAIYEIQHWLEDHNKETHVVHRVIDSLNARLMAMEDFLGFPRPNPES